MRRVCCPSVRRCTIVLLIVATSLVLTSSRSALASTGINPTINFQGKVVNSDGTNVPDGNYDFTFALYNVSSSGTAQWTETWNTGTAQVSVTDGVFRVALGTYSSLSALDFNNDTWYLGIDFNGDGEMTPRVRLTAVPYAFNAQKVNGLTVTNESGNPFSSTTTLKITDGKTVAIKNGLTFSGTDGKEFVFPNISGSSDNVVTEAFTQTLTNKVIGSTGLTFSGAATDITTGTNENFVLSPNGTGKIGFGSASPVGWFEVKGSGAGNALAIFDQLDSVAQSDILTASSAGNTKFRIDYNGNVGVGISGTTVLSSWLKLADATTSKAQINLGTGATGPSSSNKGDLWFDGTHLYFASANNTNKDLLATGSGGGTTDNGSGLTYVTTTANNFAIGGSTSSTTANYFYFQGTDGGSPANSTIYIGKTSSTNGGLTFNNTGNVSAATFKTDATGGLTLNVANAAGGLTISHAATSTTGVNGANVTFSTTGTTASADNSGLKVTVTAGGSGTTSTLQGAYIAALAGTSSSNVTETALKIDSSNWDKGLVLANTAGTYNVQLSADSTSVAGGITFGTTTPVSIYRSAAGVLTIGDGTNGVSIDTTNGGTAITYSGNSQPTKAITLSAEYPGAVLTSFNGSTDDSGSATGSMISDAEQNNTNSNAYRSYYQWTSSQGSLNSYTVAVRVTLPQDFSSWAATALTVDFATQANTSTNNTLEVRIVKSDGTSVATDTTTLTSSSAGVYRTISFTSANMSSWTTANSTAMIYLRMRSANSSYVKVSDIKLNYKAKF